jgi:hypothetical protein
MTSLMTCLPLLLLSLLPLLSVVALAASPDAAAGLGLVASLKANVLALGLGLGGPMAIAVAFLIAGRAVPGLVAGKLSKAFGEAKDSNWWREPSKPHRAKLLYAVAVFLEAEVPDAEKGQEVYDAFGVWANTHARIGAFPLGSAAQWSALARKAGDAVDLELDSEVLALADLANPPTPPAVAP